MIPIDIGENKCSNCSTIRRQKQSKPSVFEGKRGPRIVPEVNRNGLRNDSNNKRRIWEVKPREMIFRKEGYLFEIVELEEASGTIAVKGDLLGLGPGEGEGVGVEGEGVLVASVTVHLVGPVDPANRPRP